MATRWRGLFFPKHIYSKITNDISRRKTDHISTKFHRNDPWVVLSQIEFHEELWLPWQPIEKNFYKCEFLPKLLKNLTQSGQVSIIRAIMALSLLYGSGLRGTIQGPLVFFIRTISNEYKFIILNSRRKKISKQMSDKLSHNVSDRYSII